MISGISITQYIHIYTLLDDLTFCIATWLRFEAPRYSPHFCHCREAVDSLGHHALSCTRSAGRISRDANINPFSNVLLLSPALREPNGLVRDLTP